MGGVSREVFGLRDVRAQGLHFKCYRRDGVYRVGVSDLVKQRTVKVTKALAEALLPLAGPLFVTRVRELVDNAQRLNSMDYREVLHGR